MIMPLSCLGPVTPASTPARMTGAPPPVPPLASSMIDPIWIRVRGRPRSFDSRTAGPWRNARARGCGITQHVVRVDVAIHPKIPAMGLDVPPLSGAGTYRQWDPGMAPIRSVRLAGSGAPIARWAWAPCTDANGPTSPPIPRLQRRPASCPPTATVGRAWRRGRSREM